MLIIFISCGGKLEKESTTISDGDTSGIVKFAVNSSSYLISEDETKLVILSTHENSNGRLYYASTSTKKLNKIDTYLPENGAISGFKIAPNSTRIVFLGHEGSGISQLYAVDVDGTNPTQLSGTLTEYNQAVASYFNILDDSSRVIYYDGEQETGGDIEKFLRSVNLDGTGKTLLHPESGLGTDVELRYFKIIPGTSKVTYALGHTYCNFYVGDTDIQNSLNKMHEDGFGWTYIFPDWWSCYMYFSPDNTWMYFYASNEAINSTDRIYRVAADGSSNNALEVGVDRALYSFSPDGSKMITYKYNTANYISDLDGSNVNTLPYSNKMLFLPDGTKVIYRSDQASSNDYSLYSSNIDGTGEVELSGSLVENGDVGGFSLKSDSSQVLYWSDEEINGDFSFYLVAPDGSGKINISNSALTTESISSLKVSSDFTKVLFLADADGVSGLELYLLSIASGEIERISPVTSSASQVDSYQVVNDFSFVVFEGNLDVSSKKYIYIAEL